MSNDVVKQEVVDLVERKVEDLSQYNLSKGDDIVPMSLIVRTCKKSSGGTFKSIKCLMYLPCYENDKFIGYHNRKIDVSFTKDAFDDVYSECGIHKSEDLSTGTLYVRKKGIQAPNKWFITKDEKGKDKYPRIYVKKAIIGFVPYTPDDEMFKYHEPVKDADVVEDYEQYDVSNEEDEELKGIN